MKSNQSNSRHTTPKVDLHGLKFAKIVFVLSIITEIFALQQLELRSHFRKLRVKRKL